MKEPITVVISVRAGCQRTFEVVLRPREGHEILIQALEDTLRQYLQEIGAKVHA